MANANESDTSRLVRELYRDALRRDPEEWADYLDGACAGRDDVRARVEVLLGTRTDLPSRSSAPPGPSASAPPPLLEGSAIGPYIIRRELGRGGMGVVYLADDTRLSRRVALKALSPSLGDDLVGKERLRVEARAAAGLSHPSIATVYALDEIDGLLYLACEYVPGEPLRALLNSGPLPIDHVVDIALQLARALTAAHTQGVVHRDIKPENVMRTPSGIVKVLDFGLARIDQGSESAARLTQTGTIVGTPAYLSPEQAQGRAADFRTDIFALGLLTYELASGHNPFAATAITAILTRIVTEEPPPLSHRQPQSPPSLDVILARCMRKDPSERYASTQELVSDLEQLQQDLQAARRAPGRGSVPSWRAAALAHTRTSWWWEVHQLTMAVVYAVMVFPSWYVRRFQDAPWSTFLLLAVLGTAAVGASLRLHLFFIARFFPAEVRTQQQSTALRIRICDGVFAALLVVSALALGSEHPEFSMLFVVVAAASLVASFVIEPATTRVALDRAPGPSQ